MLSHKKTCSSFPRFLINIEEFYQKFWDDLLELIYFYYLFFTLIPSNSYVLLSCRPFVVNATFSTGLVGCLKFLLSPGARRPKLQHPTRPTGKTNITIGWDDDRKIGNKKFTHTYEGLRSPHANALHWNPTGFWKKKLKRNRKNKKQI